jgi:hypothetical protein
MPLITPTALRHLAPIPKPNLATAPQQSPCAATPIAMPSPTRIPQIPFEPIKGGLQNRNIMSLEAINFLTKCIWASSPNVFPPAKTKQKLPPPAWILLK